MGHRQGKNTDDGEAGSTAAQSAQRFRLISCRQMNASRAHRQRPDSHTPLKPLPGR